MRGDDGLASDESLDVVDLGRPSGQQVALQRLGRHARQLDLGQSLRLELVDHIQQGQARQCPSEESVASPSFLNSSRFSPPAQALRT